MHSQGQVIMPKKAANISYAPLHVGDTLPDIIFKDLTNYPLKNPPAAHFKGKIMILDFWSTYCSNCIEGFSKMEALQQEFTGKMQIILINSIETKEVIETRMQKMKKYMPNVGLSALPAVNGDANWRFLFPHRSVPQHVWIDIKGKVVAITDDKAATSLNVKKLLEEGKINLPLKDDLLNKEVKQIGLLLPVDATLPDIYYSCFMRYSRRIGNLPSSPYDRSKDGMASRYTFINSISGLYKTAFSKVNAASGIPIRMIFEGIDVSKYQLPLDQSKVNEWGEKYGYVYELRVPVEQESNWQEIMQEDLNQYFGRLQRINGRIEKRRFQSLVLIKKANLTLKKRGMAFKRILGQLRNLENMSVNRPFIDESGITGFVDFELKGDLSNLENIKHQLLPNGLDIIEAERTVDVLVIRNKNQY